MGDIIAKILVASILGTIGFVVLGPIGSVVGFIIGLVFTSTGGDD